MASSLHADLDDSDFLERSAALFPIGPVLPQVLCRRRHNTWDITKLAGPIKGKYYDCYVMIDIYSRYIVGAYVHAHESGELAVEMMKEIFGIHGVPQIVHADRGTSMTSKTVAALLSDLEVTRSHSRPRIIE